MAAAAVALIAAVTAAAAVATGEAAPQGSLLRSWSSPLPQIAAAAAGPTPSAACIRYRDGVAQHAVPGLALPRSPTLKLGGNVYGVGGHVTTLEQCLFRDDATDTMGWNWTRGATDTACAAGQSCKAPPCFADFSFAGLSCGRGPFGGEGTGAQQLPSDLTALESFVISQNMSWTWTDTAPGVAPPATGGVRRARLIYDFFLETTRPNGSNAASSITDEVTISLATNPGFPGSQPPGCLDPSSRFGKHNASQAVLPNAVWDGYNHYDYWYTDHHDAVPGTGSRFSSFRRVGADLVGAQAPPKVDILPFRAAIRKMWPNEAVGAWLGEVTISTELYDHCTGTVEFHAAPTFVATNLSSIDRPNLTIDRDNDGTFVDLASNTDGS